ncbi:MAG: ATP-binding protein [Bacteroidia bacterium]|nr:ATP-binding protein [Bacteroidia bacterium]
MGNKRETFRRIIADFVSKPLADIRQRAIKIPLDVPKIISLLGPRRSGKTYLLYGTILELRKSLPHSRMVYLNLEDNRLFPLSLADMEDFVAAYYELFPENKQEKVFFFLDEIQEVDLWEKFVRRLSDQENCRVFLTGSSSKLLSREIASSLRGRTISYEIFPLSFLEFLDFQDIHTNPDTSEEEALILFHLRRYLLQGGFPELIFLPESLHRRVIGEYIDLMLYKDLVERFGIRQPEVIKYLMKFLLQNIGNRMSLTKIFQDINSQGYNIGKNTVAEYISHLEEAFAIFRVPISSDSIRRQAINPDKIYAIDAAYKRAVSTTDDIGILLENAVFLHFRREGVMPAYLDKHQEVDFVLPNKELINVCYDLSSESTRSREINALREGMRVCSQNTADLYSWDERSDLTVEEGLIRIRPVWQLFLGSLR